MDPIVTDWTVFYCGNPRKSAERHQFRGSLNRITCAMIRAHKIQWWSLIGPTILD